MEWGSIRNRRKEAGLHKATLDERREERHSAFETTCTPPVGSTYCIQQEVLDFILVTEARLSPFLRSSELTEHECGLIAAYVTTRRVLAIHGRRHCRSAIIRRP